MKSRIIHPHTLCEHIKAREVSLAFQHLAHPAQNHNGTTMWDILYCCPTSPPPLPPHYTPPLEGWLSTTSQPKLCLLPPGNLTSQTSPPPALCLPNTHSPMRIHAHLHISSSSASKVHIPYPKITQLLRALLVLLLLTKRIPFSLSSGKPRDFLCLPLFSLL